MNTIRFQLHRLLALLDLRRSLQARMGVAFGGLTTLLVLLFIGVLHLTTQVNRAVFAGGTDLVVHRLQEVALVYGICLTFYFIALGWVTVGRITDPITEIATIANRIHQGETDLTIPIIEGEDEVAILSRSLNQLLADLNAQKTALQASKDELEERVNERTRKLSTLYDVLRLSSTTFQQ